jgi:hypothetical protein
MHSTGTGACQSRACYTLFVIAWRPSNKGKKTRIKSRGERRTGIRSEHPRGQYGIENVRGEGRCGRLRFGMRRRVARTRPERGRQSSRAVVSTRPLRRARCHRSRSPYASAALSSRRPSNVARDKRNDRFAPNFRHHPGVGGQQTPCYVPITVFTPPGAI